MDLFRLVEGRGRGRGRGRRREKRWSKAEGIDNKRMGRRAGSGERGRVRNP